MRRCAHYLLAAAALAGAGLVTAAPPGSAQQCSSTKQCQLQHQLDETSSAEAAARSQLANLQSKKQAQDSALAAIDARVAAAADQLASAQADADRLAAAAADLQAKVAATTKQLQQAKRDIRNSALQLYQHHDASQMLALFRAAGSGEFVEGQHYLRRVSDRRQGDAATVTRLRDALQQQQAQVEVQQKAADDARDAAASEKAQLDALQAQAAASQSEVASTEQQTHDLVAGLQSQQDALEADLSAESDRIAASLRSAAGIAPLGSGRFIRPVSAPITSPFGERTDPVTGGSEFHTGVDFGASCGTPIKAAGTGVVFETLSESQSGGYGNMTIINHGGGLATLYGHQSSIAVTQGQTVSQGQVIGYVGSTGKSTGCHLHFEVRVNGTPVEPTQYL
jgi:murein DD-endopeptidase MepM/ murein hydrolase activator NlpD